MRSRVLHRDDRIDAKFVRNISWKQIDALSWARFKKWWPLLDMLNVLGIFSQMFIFMTI